MKSKVTNLKDGDSFCIKNREVFKLKCCDCGLIHYVCIASIGNDIGVAMSRVKQHRRRFRQSLKYKTRNGKTKGSGKNSLTSFNLKPLHRHTSHVTKKGTSVK